MKTLPKYFVIKRVESPLWDKYISWLNKTYTERYNGYTHTYYGYNGYAHTAEFYDLIYIKKGYITELTLEEWYKIINGGNTTDPKYVVYVEGRQAPRKVYDDIEKAKIECNRLVKLEKQNTYVAELKYKVGVEFKEFNY